MPRKFSNILLTGATGSLGEVIVNSRQFKGLLTPSRQELDITREESVLQYFQNNKIDAVVHAAALARMALCEKDPVLAVKTNILGTSFLVNAVINKEKELNSNIRFVFISTDGVYESLRGNYSEKDPTIPYNKYGWTKLGSECAVNLLEDFCIIRARFFNPKKLKFSSYPTDSWTSSIPIDDFVKSIRMLLYSDFRGTINVGEKRISDYDLYRKIDPSAKACRLADVSKDKSFRISKDSSMNTAVWVKIRKQDKG